jgi:hypothetical protein
MTIGAMRPLIAGVLLLASAVGASTKTPSQPDILSGCLQAANIYSHGESLALSLLSFGAPEPGVEAVIRNTCGQTASVLVTVGYFDSRGRLIGRGFEINILANGAAWEMYHRARLYGLGSRRMKLTKIIKLEGF